jgi:xanthine dehydrogenase accessory factor
MLVDPAGGQLGTIGGGCGEAEVLARAQRVLATGEPALLEVSLLEEDGWESPSICGGTLDVFIERAAADIGGHPRERFFAALDALQQGGRPVAVVTLTGAARSDPAASAIGRKLVVDEQGRGSLGLGDAEADELAVGAAIESLETSRAVDLSSDGPRGLRVFAEPICEPPELVVVGAGHVGAALARLAGHVGFVVTVLDDRASFANPVRLPEAHAIRVGDPRETLAGLRPRRDRYVVLVTRGHRLDADCLEIALRMDLAYLGMIGSRRRVARIREWLLERGAPRDRVERVHAPIGLDIEAETPAEIAVAILAEMIATRRRRR